MRRSLKLAILATGCVILGAGTASAVIPYTPLPVTGPPSIGPMGVQPPPTVYGKEYSHDFDFSVTAPALVDPEQIIAWDGLGGTADTVDYTGTRPTWIPDQEIDAIANHRDALFDETLADLSHLIFSHDDVISAYGLGGGGPALVPVPSGGPILISNGNVIGGAGDVSVEESGAFSGPSIQTVWATQPEVNGMPLPGDVDGLEVWGPEPSDPIDPEFPVIGDADKYSLDVDLPSTISVWNASGTPYIPLPTIVGAVESLLGPVPATAFSLRDDTQGQQAINLDAMMVSDIVNNPDVFDEGVIDPGAEPPFDQNGEPFEPIDLEGVPRGDAIIFSIRQIVDPMDADGYYATGSELFVLDAATGIASFLVHGGHMWDHAYALASFALIAGPDGQQVDFTAYLDINAIEAIGEDVPPPMPLPGDFNDDGTVNTADYAIWRDTLGTAFDLNGNGDEVGASAGIVDEADYQLWRTNFGAMAGPIMAPSPVATPEPHAAVLLLLAAAGILAKRRS